MSCDPCKKDKEVHTYENGPVSETDNGIAFRVSDRNGNPRNAKPNPHSLAHSNDDGVSKMRDGSESNPITLKLKKASGAGIVITKVDEDGTVVELGRVESDGSDAFVMIKNGEVTFVKSPTIKALFTEEEVPGSKTGKIALLSCGPDGTLQLNRFAGCGQKQNVVVDAEGNVICEVISDCDDAEEATEAGAIRMCVDGEEKFVKPNEAEDKIIVSCEGVWKIVKRPVLEYLRETPTDLTIGLGNPFTYLPTRVDKAVGTYALPVTLPDFPVEADTCGRQVYAIIRVVYFLYEIGSSSESTHAFLKFNDQHLLTMAANQLGSASGGADFTVPADTASNNFNLEVYGTSCTCAIAASIVGYKY